jgi:hypothetical protein
MCSLPGTLVAIESQSLTCSCMCVCRGMRGRMYATYSNLQPPRNDGVGADWATVPDVLVLCPLFLPPPCLTWTATIYVYGVVSMMYLYVHICIYIYGYEHICMFNTCMFRSGMHWPVGVFDSDCHVRIYAGAYVCRYAFSRRQAHNYMPWEPSLH